MAVGVDDYSSESDVLIIPSALDFVSQDEMLTPLGRLDKYIASENTFNRQMVARGLLDTLRAVSDDEKDCLAVLERINKLAEDPEPTVRAELMEQVPHIAIFCQENRPCIPYAFSKYLLPFMVRCLADPNNQVRKTSQAALLVVLEQEIIERYDVETKVCPVLLDLTAPESNDDLKTEAVAIMCKMAPMVGKAITEKYILHRFCEMCCDCRMFHVRKVCAANIGDISSVVGREATERLLLPRFFQLCSDNVWGVRKACAECFMDVSCATSQEIRRTKLSSLFINLISDPSRWVRQAAFQSLGPFISTFASCSGAGHYFKEENVLSSKNVLENQGTENNNNSAKCAAEPTKVADGTKDNLETEEKTPGFNCSTVGSVNAATELYSKNEYKTDSKCSSDASHSQATSLQLHSDSPVCTKSEGNRGLNVSELPNLDSADPSPSSKESGSSSEKTAIPEDMFNSFHYWRTPIPTIDLDLELELPQCSNKQKSKELMQEEALTDCPGFSTATRTELEEMLENLEPHIDDPDVKAQVDVLTAALRASTLDFEEGRSLEPLCNRTKSQADPMKVDPVNVGQDHVPLTAEISAPVEEDCVSDTVYSTNQALDASPFSAMVSDDRVFTYFETNLEGRLQFIQENSCRRQNSFEDDKKSKIQDVVPQALLDQYLSMTDPSRAQTVDTELAKHCAYSLPGVAFTLGRQNWHCLKNTYEILASDMQWKVRRTLAFSIHELAVILGDQLTAADLVPVFNGFLKDLDEVRIGVLKHLYDFMKLLQAEKRREYLPQLQEFMVTDNSRNWRFRAELSEQLILLLELYNPKDVYDYLRPISLSLCADKVSSVRWIAYRLVGEMIRKFYASATPALAVDLIHELVDKFCHSVKWSGRQAFVFVCQAVLEDDCIPVEQFTEHLMPHLLQLASDPVPNVRVLLAKTLRQTLLEKEYFVNSGSSHQEAIEQIAVVLQADRDRDVRYFASIYPSSTKLGDDSMSTASSTY
ncbi:serine/threonine-protein phosphatase 4 regulatory subunit 1-like isoform X2 [Stegostoma tigrinum]|uniref:serine/threonine-protein phosphatase 4 regulatory subunit 1-like isoform X2 n=1 Tax=Stegostoma tigrinum TaxID=3053191 RepID=UPI00202B8671|nr:serine/threonine-protein phosphatase 4 regulatory subunit 1-like isoform X2 [Stegostoma tigrinum]